MTVDYCERTLGFQQQWIWGVPPVHAGISAGDALLYVCHDSELACANRRAAFKSAPDIYLWVENLQSLYAQHRASNAEIVDELKVKPWGHASVHDSSADGYRLKIAALEESEHQAESQ